MNLYFLFGIPFLGGVEKSLKNSAADLIDKAIGTKQMDKMELLTRFTKGGSLYSDFWKIINNALNIVKPFGYALITTYFLMYLFDSAAKDQVTVDTLIKVLIQLVIVVAVIKNLDTIINTFLSISDSLIVKFSGHTKGGGGKKAILQGEEIVKKWSEKDGCFSIFLQAVIFWLFGIIAKVAVHFAAISRAIEVGWRCIFAPIGVANCFEGGANSKGMQYIKALGVAALSGAAIYITASIGFSLTAGILSNGTDRGTMFLALAAYFATAGAAIGAGNKLRELI